MKSGTQREKLRRRNKKIKKEGAECRGDTYLFELRFKGHLKRSKRESGAKMVNWVTTTVAFLSLVTSSVTSRCHLEI